MQVFNARIALLATIALSAACTAQASRAATVRAVSTSADDPDHDGVRGAADQCPTLAEDLDRVGDEDGCPELDQDCDQVADREDACPSQAEDRDQFQDTDGCPDDDNDGDRITDRCDRCPNENETYNGYMDADGCPDRTGSSKMTEIRIVLSVGFRRQSAQIEPRNIAVLEQLTRTLQQHPEIRAVVVVGHAARDERDVIRLSRDRAEVVRAWLAQHGVDAQRMTARGAGTSEPLDAANTAAARDRNRRVVWEVVNVPVAATPYDARNDIERCEPASAITSVAGRCATTDLQR